VVAWKYIQLDKWPRLIRHRDRPQDFALLKLLNDRQNIASFVFWAILIWAIISSFKPLTPLIWDDSPVFVESALRTLETGSPTVVGGRDPGYPIFLALTFAVGRDLGFVVLVQQTAWAALMIALAATAQTVTRSPYALGPIILLVMYPGLLIYRNTITATILYTVFLNLSVLALLLATKVSGLIRCWLVTATVLLMAIAACLKSQGFPVLIAVIPLAVWIAWPWTPSRLALLVLSCVCALALLATGSRIGASSSDRYSVVFGPKTLFCNHLNIVLASEAARREIATAAGNSAEDMLARLAVDLGSKRQNWPTLGFYGGECQFDTDLDKYLMNNGTTPNEVADSYRRIFLTAVLDHPLQYMGKIIHQMLYAVWFSWPPHALGPSLSGSPDAVAGLSVIMHQYGLSSDAINLRNEAISGWPLSDLGRFGTLLFRGLSAAFAAALLFSTMIAIRGRNPEFSVPAGTVIVLWGSSIFGTAAASSLDVWRYVIPATPMVGLLLAMVSVQLVRTIIPQGDREDGKVAV
jgi:hypothetical protein